MKSRSIFFILLYSFAITFGATLKNKNKLTSSEKEHLRSLLIRKDALLDIQDTDQGYFVAKGKTYYMKDAKPINKIKPGATYIIEGKEMVFPSLKTLRIDSDNEVVIIAQNIEGDVKSISIVDKLNGNTEYLETVFPGNVATITESIIDHEELSKFRYGEDISGDGRVLHPLTERKLETSCSDFKVIDLAIAFESSFCAKEGNYADATNEVNNLVALVSAKYEQAGLCTKVQVSHLEGYCDASTDPYKASVDLNLSGCSNTGLLQGFQNYWMANKADVERDSAHLFSGTGLECDENGSCVIGCAYLGVMCSSDSGYGVNYVSFTDNSNLRAVLIAHELGHNADASHYNVNNYIMYPSVNTAINGFSTTTINSFLNHFDEVSCIDVEASDLPSIKPSSQPSLSSTSKPSEVPTSGPSLKSDQPSKNPSSHPSFSPSSNPTTKPSLNPSTSKKTSFNPSFKPSLIPTSEDKSNLPSLVPSPDPSLQPTTKPSLVPTFRPSNKHSDIPSVRPSFQPSSDPSLQPSSTPSSAPTSTFSLNPTHSSSPTLLSSSNPSLEPTKFFSSDPTMLPSYDPSPNPTFHQSLAPSEIPSVGNDPLPMSWNISMIPPLQHLIDSNMRPVMGITYLISNRDFDINIFQDNCKTNITVLPFEFEDNDSSSRGFLDVNVNITINQGDIEASSIWNETDKSFKFCLSTTLYLNEIKIEENIITQNNIVFNVKVNKEFGFGSGTNYAELFAELDTSGDGKLGEEEVEAYFTDKGQQMPAGFFESADTDNDGFVSLEELSQAGAFSGSNGFDFIVEDITNFDTQYNDDFVIDLEGNVTAYQCDPDTMQPLAESLILGPLDILNICVQENSAKNVSIGAVIDLTLEQQTSFVTFVAVIDGSIKEGYDDIVLRSCAAGKCVTRIQLINSFFLEEEPYPIDVTGSALLAFGGSGRFVSTSTRFKATIDLGRRCDVGLFSTIQGLFGSLLS